MVMAVAAEWTWVEFLGVVAGLLGICISIFLRLVLSREVSPRYTLSFLVVGFVVFVLAAAPHSVFIEPPVMQALVYSAVLVGELYSAHRLYRQADIISFGRE